MMLTLYTFNFLKITNYTENSVNVQPKPRFVRVITGCCSLLTLRPTSGSAFPPSADSQPCKGTHSSIIDNWLGQVRWRGNL